MGVSKNSGTPKSSILIGFSIIFTIHLGVPLFLETPIYLGGQRYQRCTPLAIWSLRVYLLFKKRGYEKSHHETPMPMDVENQSSLLRPDKATLPKLIWNPKNNPLKRKIILENLHFWVPAVNFQGCTRFGVEKRSPENRSSHLQQVLCTNLGVDTPQLRPHAEIVGGGQSVSQHLALSKKIQLYA